jgi:hypothetical protein
MQSHFAQFPKYVRFPALASPSKRHDQESNSSQTAVSLPVHRSALRSRHTIFGSFRTGLTRFQGELPCCDGSFIVPKITCLTDDPITGSGRYNPKKLAYQDLCLIFLSLEFDDLILDGISNPIRWLEGSSSHEARFRSLFRDGRVPSIKSHFETPHGSVPN